MKGQKRETRGGVVTDIKLGCAKKERESTGKEQATPLLGGKSEKKRVTKMERKKVFKSKNVEREEEKQ